MKYVVALMAVILVGVLAVTCGTMPVTEGAEPTTATLVAWGGGSPGEPVPFTVMGSGLPINTDVVLKINNVPGGTQLGDPVTTNEFGCFSVTRYQPDGLVQDKVYAIEAYVVTTLWATFPWVASYPQ